MSSQSAIDPPSQAVKDAGPYPEMLGAPLDADRPVKAGARGTGVRDASIEGFVGKPVFTVLAPPGTAKRCKDWAFLAMACKRQSGGYNQHNPLWRKGLTVPPPVVSGPRGRRFKSCHPDSVSPSPATTWKSAAGDLQ